MIIVGSMSTASPTLHDEARERTSKHVWLVHKQQKRDHVPTHNRIRRAVGTVTHPLLTFIERRASARVEKADTPR